MGAMRMGRAFGVICFGCVATACGGPLDTPEAGGSDFDSDSMEAATTPAAAPKPTEPWLDQARTRIDVGSHRFFARASGFFAENAAEGLWAHFDEQGVHVSRRAAPEAALTMRLAGWGRAGSTSALAPQRFRLGSCGQPSRLDAEGKCLEQLEADFGGIREWWDNHPEKLEQGFTIAGRPSGNGLVELRIQVDGATLSGSSGNVVSMRLADGGTLSYDELRVVDARGDALESSLSAVGTQIVIQFDDTDATYPVVVDPIVTSPAWEVLGAGLYGHDLAGAGDINGDGYDDVVIGAPGYDAGGEDSGRAFVYFGSASGLEDNARWTKDGSSPFASYGWAVSSAGDINADGFSDVLVGEPQSDALIYNGGSAYIYLGSAAGLAATPVWTASGDLEHGWFGNSVATAGDTNGDGKSDILIGAPNMSDGHAREGGVFLFQTSAAGLDNVADWLREPHEENARMGESIAGVGDINGDGLGDFVIAAPYWGADDRGRIWGYLGRLDSVPGNSSWNVTGTTEYEHRGFSVGGAGDVNGDGYADFLIASPEWHSVFDYPGRATLYFGAPAGFVSGSREFESGLAGGSKSINGVGDVDGDGLADMAYCEGSDSSGKVHYGVEGLGFADLPSCQGIVSAGDVNGDGLSDVLTSGPDLEARQFNGSQRAITAGAGTTETMLTDSQTNSGFGSAFATCDIDSDGDSDLLVGAQHFDDGQPGAGIVYGYLGSAAGLGASANWSATGGANDAHFGGSGMGCADFNNDGYVDLAVGSADYDEPDVSGSLVDAGRVSIHYGQADLLNSTAGLRLSPHQTSARYGKAIVVGNFNGDAYMDLVIGSPGYTNDQVSEGRAWVYYGSATGITLVGRITLEGSKSNAAFGAALASGDFNGDGFDDLAVGSHSYSNVENQEGRVYFYYGASGGLSATAAVTSPESDRSGSFFGAALAATDVDGDGDADLMVGAPSYTNGSSEEGRVFLYLGASTGLGSASQFYESNQAAGRLGEALSAGDYNNDGIGDLAVGFPGYTRLGAKQGRFLLFRGAAGGTLATTPSVTINGASDKVGFGSRLNLTGDFNGDGLSDVATHYYTPATSGGSVPTYHLPKGGASLSVRRPGTSLGIHPGSKSPSRAIDVRVMARSPFGRTRAKVQIEVKPRATAFNGQGLITSPDWTDTGRGGRGILAAVTGLAANTAYHLRARIRYEPTSSFVASHSRWHYGGLPGQKNGVHFRTP